MKKILITGCSGFLAGSLVQILEKEKNNKIFGITEVPGFKSKKMQVYNQDIRDRDKVIKIAEEVKPDITFHLAAISNVGFSWKNQKLTYEVNFIGSSNLMEGIQRHAPCSRLLLMSSAELYGNAKVEINEHTGISARNPYSLSKYAMELLADLYTSENSPQIIKIRSFNFTGPGQNTKFVASDFAFQISEIEKGRKKPELKVGNISVIRDFSDVRDIARYLKTISQKGERGEIFNLCSGKCYSIKEIIDILLSLSKKEIQVIQDPNKFRPADIPVLQADNSLLKERFNLFPQYDIEETLFQLLEYWRNQT
jgi:GDP-4-dehydro-6-deoxy-D-mannose reductase